MLCPLVQSYDPRMVAGERTVGRWWNGRWSRLLRRDVWLKTNGTLWRVEIREGDGDSDRRAGRTFATEIEGPRGAR